MNLKLAPELDLDIDQYPGFHYISDMAGRPRTGQAFFALTALAGLALAVVGCSHITPLNPDPVPRHLQSPITMQIMRNQPSTPTGRCPAGTVALFGSQPNVLRVRATAPAVGPPHPVSGHTKIVRKNTATPPPTPPAPSAGVACYRPVGRPVTITSAAVSSVTTNRNQPGPAWYVFVVTFPTADVPALTALIHQAYGSGDALGMSVAGKLWQAPQPRRRFIALRAEQVNLLSRAQAFRLYHMLVRSG